MPERPQCPECGSVEITAKRDVGVWEWNWTCHDCNTGDAELK